MGLDMYFIRVKAEDVVDDFTIKKREGFDLDENMIKYYRKYYDLHKVMCEIYCNKKNTIFIGDFNESMMHVTIDDLDNIAKNTNLDARKIIDLIEKLRKVWKSGDSVYYLPSW